MARGRIIKLSLSLSFTRSFATNYWPWYIRVYIEKEPQLVAFVCGCVCVYTIYTREKNPQRSIESTEEEKRWLTDTEFLSRSSFFFLYLSLSLRSSRLLERNLLNKVRFSLSFFIILLSLIERFREGIILMFTFNEKKKKEKKKLVLCQTAIIIEFFEISCMVCKERSNSSDISLLKRVVWRFTLANCSQLISFSLFLLAAKSRRIPSSHSPTFRGSEESDLYKTFLSYFFFFSWKRGTTVAYRAATDQRKRSPTPKLSEALSFCTDLSFSLTRDLFSD